MAERRVTIGLTELTEETLARIVQEHNILREAVQNSPVHFCVYDSHDRLVAWNASYEENYPDAFEVLRDKAMRREVTYADLMRHQLSRTHPPEEVEAEVARRIALQANARGEGVVRDYGTHILRVHKYRLPSGAVAGLAVDITDLQERQKELETARRSAERAARSKSAFLANMSHEIRTPLGAIIGLAGLLDASGLDEGQRSYVNLILTSAEALLGTINEILDFSKFEEGKSSVERVPMDLGRVLREVVDLMCPTARAKGLVLEAELADDLPHWVLGDALRLRQCLLNLLGNAVKFTEQGRVTVRALPAEDDMVEISVADTGVGISEDGLEEIFEAFSQVDDNLVRRAGGTGLGLAITRKLVELMGGTVTVRSRLGEGSTFTLRVPFAACDAPEASEHDRRRRAAELVDIDLAGRRVLIADDNRTNRLLLTRFLEPTGADLVLCETGRQVVEAVRKDPPDLVLMDVSMPDMGGIEATETIRELESSLGRAPVPIVALTAYASDEDRERCLAAGMTDFLSKPFGKPDLFALLYEVVQSG